MLCVQHNLKLENNGLQMCSVNIFMRISDFRCGFGPVSQFVGYSPGKTTIDYNTFCLTVIILNCKVFICNALYSEYFTI